MTASEAALRAAILHDLRADLLTEAGQLLDTARRNDAAGRKGNAATARSQAWGLCRARVVLGRWTACESS